METQKTPLLNWPYYYYQLNNYQGKSMEELKNALICTTLELETTRLAAQEEIRKREEELTHLQELLHKALTERDEAQQTCKSLFLDKFLLQQQQQQQQQSVHSGSSSTIVEEDDPITAKKLVVDFDYSNKNHNNNGGGGGNLSSSDCDESIISSPQSPPPPSQPPHPHPVSALPESAMKLLPTKKALPEKGNLLQAVIKAGPLLQTLLLAGPLPQWRHPPPALENFDIPPVKIPVASVNQSEITADYHDDRQQDFFINTPTNNNGADNCGFVSRKRVFSYDHHSAFEASKYQRVLLH